MLRYGFFDSEITGFDEQGMPIFDRAESSDFLAMFISHIISDGVLGQPGDCFQVLAGEGMKLRVSPGFAVIQGRFAVDRNVSTVTIPTAPTSHKRMDRVVLRANYHQRLCELVVKEGVPAAVPVPPELLQPESGDYYELCLATVLVGQNQGVITQANITDTRYDSRVCGVVTQVIDHLNTSVFFAQLDQFYREFVTKSDASYAQFVIDMQTCIDALQASGDAQLLKLNGEFVAWFDGVKNQVTGDMAVRIQKQLDDHEKDTGNPHKMTKEQIGLENADNTSDANKPVSTAQQAALDELHQQLVAYTNQKIAGLINGAPSTLDTLKEVADAISAHKTIMDALDAAIGKKAGAAEFDSHTKDTTKHVTAAERTSWNGKLAPTGDASNVTATFTQASTRANISSKESLKTSMGKIMKWFADLANGAASTLLGSNLTANRALVANANGKVAVSAVTATELGYLDGVTSGIQGQLNELNTHLQLKDYIKTGNGNNLAFGEIGKAVTVWLDGESLGALPVGSQAIRAGAGTAYVNANSYTDVDVVFTVPYAVVPVVIPVGGHAGKWGNSGVMLLSTTTTGFKLRVYNVSSGAADLFYRWIAMPANP